jgi:hypothetical protein
LPDHLLNYRIGKGHVFIISLHLFFRFPERIK